MFSRRLAIDSYLTGSFIRHTPGPWRRQFQASFIVMYSPTLPPVYTKKEFLSTLFHCPVHTHYLSGRQCPANKNDVVNIIDKYVVGPGD